MRESTNTSKWAAALRAAAPYTIPIFAGYWFLGLTYGILMNVSGFSFVWPMMMAAVIYSGSVEFVVKTEDIHPPKTGISVHFCVLSLMAMQK